MSCENVQFSEALQHPGIVEALLKKVALVVGDSHSQQEGVGSWHCQPARQRQWAEQHPGRAIRLERMVDETGPIRCADKALQMKAQPNVVDS